jgi:hypothetical protein
MQVLPLKLCVSCAFQFSFRREFRSRLATVRRNRYSVPCELAGHMVGSG